MPRPPRQPAHPDAPPARRMRGFEAASGLLSRRIQKAGESRGFAIARLLTHWPDIAGSDLAALTRPIKVSYGREGMGATLLLLVSGAHAPLVEMQKERLRSRVNAVYGYNAISRITLSQTAPSGFADGQADFAPAPKPAGRMPAAPLPEAVAVAEGVADSGLRAALETLAQNVLTRSRAHGPDAAAGIDPGTMPRTHPDTPAGAHTAAPPCTPPDTPPAQANRTK